MTGLIRLERRLDTPKSVLALMPLVCVALALAGTTALLLATGNNPATTFRQIIDAAFLSGGALSATLRSATPLLFTGLAAALAFRMKVWNIGGEGQLYIGAIAGAAAGLVFGGAGLAIALPAMILAAIAGGAFWAAIPGVLRSYLNTNEILTSLMLNYVALQLLNYLIFDSNSFLRDLTSASAKVFPSGKKIDGSAFWPGFVGPGVIVPTGFLIGLMLAVALTVLVRATRYGFQMRVISDSPTVGRYAGMRTGRAFVIVMMASGGLAGLAGASQVGDFSHQLEPIGLSTAAFGYTGIVVAALARYSACGVVLTAALLGGLTNAGFVLQGASFPLGLVGTMQGILLFFAIGGEILARYRIRLARFRSGSGTAHTADSASNTDDPAFGERRESVPQAVMPHEEGHGGTADTAAQPQLASTVSAERTQP
jgi:ABC-type uncharacterized transport system permease subunit